MILCQFNFDEIASTTIHLSSSFLVWKIQVKNFGRCRVFPGNFIEANLQNKFVMHTYISGLCLYLGG